ncbi:MAG TPA: hypothetical protein VJA47_02075 [archaeon]|nr:hypothetical protein [archaeon]
MPTIHEQLLSEGFSESAKFDMSELVDRVQRNIPDLQTYDYRIVPFYIAHGLKPEETRDLDRSTHIIYIRH